MNKIHKTIAAVRRFNRVTQKELAEYLQLEIATLSRIEAGKIMLTYNRLTEIASFFNMDIVDLITWPKKYICTDNLAPEEIRASVTIELQGHEKIEILEKILGPELMKSYKKNNNKPGNNTN